MWNRSPEAYQELSKSGMLRLPSGRLLQYYKNSIQQKPGLNEEVLQWMEQEADKVKLTELGRCGGIILDEMSIQVLDLIKRVSFHTTHALCFHALFRLAGWRLRLKSGQQYFSEFSVKLRKI